VLVEENWSCDYVYDYPGETCDYDGRFEDHEGLYSVYVRELVVHGLVGVELSAPMRGMRPEHVFHAGPIFVVAREKNPQWDYETQPWGMMFGYSGTVALLEGGE
jgi:hypothetical protein